MTVAITLNFLATYPVATVFRSLHCRRRIDWPFLPRVGERLDVGADIEPSKVERVWHAIGEGEAQVWLDDWRFRDEADYRAAVAAIVSAGFEVVA